MKIERRYQPGGLAPSEAPDLDDLIHLDVPVCVALEQGEPGAVLIEYEVEGLAAGRKSDRVVEGCDVLPYRLVREHFIDGRRLHLAAMREGGREYLWQSDLLMTHDSDGKPVVQLVA